MPENRANLPEVMSVFPLESALLLPHSQLPLNIFEPRYIALIDGALSGNRTIGMVQPRDPKAQGDAPKVYDIGCTGRLTTFQEYDDGRYFITLSGLCRFEIVEELATTTPYRQFKVDYSRFLKEDTGGGTELDADRDRFMQIIHAYVDIQGFSVNWDMIEQTDTLTLVNAGATLVPWEASEKQALLEAPDMQSRYEILVTLYEMAIAQATGSQGRAN